MKQVMINDKDLEAKVDSETLLRGRWLLVARLFWVILALAIVVLNVLAVPAAVTSTFLTTGIIKELHTLHFSQMLYLILVIGINGLCIAGYLLLAALIFWRRSSDRMAYFGSLSLLTFGGGVNGFPANITSPSLVWNLVTFLPYILGQTTFLAFFFLFPSGRFVPRWSFLLVLLGGAYWTVLIIVPTLNYGPLSFLIFPFLLTVIISQVYRYRRISTFRQRQQTRWVVFGFVTAMLLFLLTRVIFQFLPQTLLNSQVAANLIGGGSSALLFLLIPLFIAIAILRDQLFNIDQIINRTLVYGLLTAILVGLYLALTIGVETLISLLADQTLQPVSLVFSTLVVAALFQPLRHRVQNVIDRRFYRRKYDAQKTLAAFASTLHNEVHLQELREHVLAVVNETMQPVHISLWLRAPRQSIEQSSYHFEQREIRNKDS